jgi:uncharacterized protein
MRSAFVLIFVLTLSLRAQLVTRPSITAAGSATVSAPPDQATINATVTTNGTSAQDASAKNATQVTGLMAALTKLLGQSASIRTTYYYVYPIYQTGPNNVISGYQASSTVEVILSDLTQAGAVIDTAVASGATSIGGVYFSIKDSEPQRQQALRLATQQAMSHANAMAAGAGHTVGSIRSIQEGNIVQVVPIYNGIGGGAAGGVAAVPTPVQPGTIQVQETVTITADLN